jgi:EF-P beta-lysylation protein EpmB
MLDGQARTRSFASDRAPQGPDSMSISGHRVDPLDSQAVFVPRYRTWQEALKDAVRDAVELCRLLDLPDKWAVEAAAAAGDFPIFAPRGYIARMRRGDPCDPLLRQVLPLREELATPAGYNHDPLSERAAAVQPGLLHKYQSRVLMVTTSACAVHCRYCFRRHFPYSDGPRSPDDWEPAIRTIESDSAINEVILSGGDPLTLVDSHLEELARRLARIDHVRWLRVHTRLPIVLPERVTDELLAWLHGTRLRPIMVVHANHPNELDNDVAAALARLADAGVMLLNQSVLLRGVNDDADVLTELSRRLIDLRVMPYYLHQLDRVSGAAHFEVDERRGLDLVEQLRRRLSGYAVPRYVREVAGELYKTVIGDW